MCFFQILFFIMMSTTAVIIAHKIKPIHKGDKTHSQDQVIVPVNFNVINTIANIPKKLKLIVSSVFSKYRPLSSEKRHSSKMRMVFSSTFLRKLSSGIFSPNNNSLTEILSNSHKGCSSDTSGNPFPVSHRDTVLLLTPNFSATCSCVKLRSFLQ